MAGKSGDNIGARVLIMLYAAAIVAIGAHPFEKRHGGLFSYLKKESASLVKRDWLPENLLDGKKRFELGDIKMPKRAQLGRGGKTGEIGFRTEARKGESGKSSKELDRLSKSDRSELGSLIDAVAQE